MFYVVNFNNENTLCDEFRNHCDCFDYTESININQDYTIETCSSEDNHLREAKDNATH